MPTMRSPIQVGFLLALGACTGLADGGPERPEPAENGLAPEPQESADLLREVDMLLAERRPAIEFARQTPAERTRVAEKAARVLRELYVNRQAKKDFYGAAVDPLPAIDALVENAEALSDAAFQTELRRIFSSQRDNHLQLVLDRPMLCFSSVLPFTFRDVLDERTGLQVVAVELANVERMADVLTSNGTFLTPDPALRAVRVGDVLHRVDGRPVDDVVDELGIQGSGANESGQHATGVALLGFRFHGLVPLPSADSVTLTLAHADGGEFDVTVPWISRLEPGCLAPPAPTEPEQRGSEAENLFVEQYSRHVTREREWARNQRTPGFRIGGEGPTPQDDDVILDTGGFLGKLQTTPRGRFGVLEIHDFSPPFEIDPMLELLEDVLRQFDEEADALLIDVRNNPGGIAEIAEAMTRFFVAGRMQVSGVRFLNTPANDLLIPAMFGKDSVFDLALQKAKAAGERFSEPTPMINADFVNDHYGHVFTKPVIVLTNAFCYSACDIFSAAMQDNGAAVIYGLHRFTGAGGATVIDTQFVGSLLGADSPVESDGTRITFAHRQFVRGGLHQGALLEDFGVERDRAAFVTLEELRAGVDLEVALRKRMLNELGDMLP